jgi:hypothetical protein
VISSLTGWRPRTEAETLPAHQDKIESKGLLRPDASYLPDFTTRKSS